MSELKITEAGSVQFPMVRHAAEIGWTPLSPSDALAMRGGEAGLLFRGVLEEALHHFNPFPPSSNSARDLIRFFRFSVRLVSSLIRATTMRS